MHSIIPCNFSCFREGRYIFWEKWSVSLIILIISFIRGFHNVDVDVIANDNAFHNLEVAQNVTALWKIVVVDSGGGELKMWYWKIWTRWWWYSNRTPALTRYSIPNSGSLRREGFPHSLQILKMLGVSQTGRNTRRQKRDIREREGSVRTRKWEKCDIDVSQY